MASSYTYFPNLDGDGRADMHSITHSTKNTAETWYNRCGLSDAKGDDGPVQDPSLPNLDEDTYIWDHAPDFSNDTYLPYPPLTYECQPSGNYYSTITLETANYSVMPSPHVSAAGLRLSSMGHTTSSAKEGRRDIRCRPWKPDLPIERTVTTIAGLWIYGWPSKGGLIVLSHPTRVDFDYLGWDYLEPPRKRDPDQDAEDEVCKMLLRLGATWYDSRSRYELLSGVTQNVSSALDQFLDDGVPAVTTVESLWIRVGWPSTGGLWVAEIIHGAFAEVVDDSVKWDMQDTLYGNAAGQIVLPKDMDERCEILKRLGGRFFASLDDYDGKGCLKAWEQKTTGEAGPLVLTRYVEQ